MRCVRITPTTFACNRWVRKRSRSFLAVEAIDVAVKHRLDISRYRCSGRGLRVVSRKFNHCQVRCVATTNKAAGVLSLAHAPAETLYEQEGVSLVRGVRLVSRATVTCEVSAEGQSPAAYEVMRANHGEPLHV